MLTAVFGIPEKFTKIYKKLAYFMGCRMASLKKAVCQVLTVDPAKKRIQVSDTRRHRPQILD